MHNILWAHLLHVALYITFTVFFLVQTGAVRLSALSSPDINPVERYGVLGALILYVMRFLPLMALPQCLANTYGLIRYNVFSGQHLQLRVSPLLAPFVCFRTVTRGDFPALVRANVARNLATCRKLGLTKFCIEVVTDTRFDLGTETLGVDKQFVRMVVVPTTYRSKTGALFKARALQFCLEDDVNWMSDDDWLVHLDEETVLTERSVKGILNFCEDGTHQFGQGLITYANERVVNWVTTLSDSFRVSEDLGKLRCSFATFNRPLFGWKGSYVVTQVGAERRVSYDHGPDGSVAEDCYFSLIATQEGYSFGWIEGEMWEKSPFTIGDFMRQRKRWVQGIFLVVHSPRIHIRSKLLLALSLYAWASLPCTIWNTVFVALCPLPPNPLADFLIGYIGAVSLYAYAFGAFKSLSFRYRRQPVRLCLATVGAACTIPFNVVIETAAVLWGLFGAKHSFYVVNKAVPPSAVEAQTA